MRQRQAVVAAAFAAVILASLLLVRPRGSAVAPRSGAPAIASAAPAPAPSAATPAAPRTSGARPDQAPAAGLAGTPRVATAPALTLPPARADAPAASPAGPDAAPPAASAAPAPAVAPALSAAPAEAAAPADAAAPAVSAPAVSAPAVSAAAAGAPGPAPSSPPAAPASDAVASASADEAPADREPAAETASAPPLDPRLTGAVAGAVRGSDGEAIAGTTVLAVSADGEDAAETTTDDDGAFLVAGLRPGRYALFAGLGTPVASRVAVRGVEIRPAAVTRVDLLEPAEGTVVRVSPHDARGRPAEAQAVLVSGAPSASGAVGSLLASDAIYLPELGGARTLLPRVPPGVYTLVLLQGAGVPVRAARDPVRISSERELVVDIELASAAVPRG